MTRRFSQLISWGCTAVIITVPLAALYFLFDINSFAALATGNLGLPIQWDSVLTWQWYTLWFLISLYLAPGLVGLYFLRRAFANFATGELFNQANSCDLRRFSMLLFLQAFAKPVHLALSSVLLSLHHPAGEKMLSIGFGSNEITVIVLAMILWVTSDLLVEGSKLQAENSQFV